MRLPMSGMILLLVKKWNPSEKIRSRSKETRHESEQGKKRKHSRGIYNTSTIFIFLLMPMILLKLVQMVISSVTPYNPDIFQYQGIKNLLMVRWLYAVSGLIITQSLATSVALSFTATDFCSEFCAVNRIGHLLFGKIWSTSHSIYSYNR